MSEVIKFTSLTDIAIHFRKDLTGDHRPLKELVLFFAHNGTGKTRLSMEFKEAGKVYDEEEFSWAKKELMMHVIDKSGYSLTKNTMLSEKKFNLFCINLKAGDNIG